MTARPSEEEMDDKGRQPLDWKSPEVRLNCCPICRVPGVPGRKSEQKIDGRYDNRGKLGLLGCAKRPTVLNLVALPHTGSRWA
ncbi:hypothetical protein MCOR27_001996 [Pyricularia oryzae]|uniref:Uncharacterized protein n=5 Tax=Pyricularia TaxID=48558 RepID=A0ABQ8NP23_PYRGI|nr:uncharacterized protein MGG_16838 [Pyricularia oryzae 70-15]ELQ44599.1 hypothetical protein OOU_Y34scaffold00071g15 [Pyricularia oryzae Y34]KAH9430191.1 hypothetical protein MCOR02_009913 [Pyricularia oryzae]KAI6299453.1 hypothetical protein MCOR33_004588 [Pyricularia grisea]EHA52678.1 hypothetical protein MGG_16838 [Pyricularia oryzae 70-15]KAI6263324.1 hypothetical protein MCOR19_000449 [Pyricularia oryzae]